MAKIRLRDLERPVGALQETEMKSIFGGAFYLGGGDTLFPDDGTMLRGPLTPGRKDPVFGYPILENGWG